MMPHGEKQTVKIIEYFFLRRNDGELYAFLQEVLEKPLAEKRPAEPHGNQFEAEKMAGLKRSSTLKKV